MKRKIIQVNKLLLKKYGVPPRNKKLPNPVDLLIATILSQNTNDKNSYQAFQNLRKKYPDWETAAKAKTSEIEKTIKIAGLGKQKSKAIKNFLVSVLNKKEKITLNYLKNNSNDEILNELTDFIGIGVKTASCVLLFSLDRNVCPVDTHVHRTLNRIGIVNTKTPDKTFNKINQNLPEGIAHQFHTNLIRLGREICKPQKPLCLICPLLKVCKFKEKNLTDSKIYKENDFMLLDNVK